MTKHLAIVFPGQGSQSVGMLADIAAQYQEVQQVFSAASHVLGYDLWKMTSEGSAEVLDKTVHTQPALLAASYAVWLVMQTRKLRLPHLLAGHSLGEYTALVCAGALTFTDAIRLVAARGEYMQSAVAAEAGAMAAVVGLEDAVVAALCQQVAAETGEIITPANFNSIGQVVVAGHKNAVERLVLEARGQGAKMAVLIPVSVPSHCELMKPAAERLAALLATIKIHHPALPVVNNADVSVYESADQIRDGLVRQLYTPVRWVETIQFMLRSGVTEIIECGPGKVLTGLNKRIDQSLQLTNTHDLPNLEAYLRLEAGENAQ